MKIECKKCKYSKIEWHNLYSIGYGIGNRVRCMKIRDNYLPTFGYDAQQWVKKEKGKCYKEKIWFLTIGLIRYWKNTFIIKFWNIWVRLKLLVVRS